MFLVYLVRTLGFQCVVNTTGDTVKGHTVQPMCRYIPAVSSKSKVFNVNIRHPHAHVINFDAFCSSYTLGIGSALPLRS